MTVDSPLISVIVPTRDRARALSRCLEALSAQTVAEQVEVIVVDDGSSAETEIASVVGRYPCARVIRQDGRGPAAARNAGARDARGTVLCFTDDDCAPRTDWIERLVGALPRGADIAAGTTLSDGGVLAEASELVAHAPAAIRAPKGRDLPFAPSNNLACTKAVFDAVPFDEAYPNAAGEDRAWCARLTAAGYVLRSEPTACLVHHQELTFRSFLRQQVRYGEGAFRFRRGGSEPRSLESGAFYAALMRRAFVHSFRVGLLVVVAQAATSVGFIRAWAAQRWREPAVNARTEPSTSRRDGS